jgi:Type I phosphodiesterase / nucleotide pyrophosphatase
MITGKRWEQLFISLLLVAVWLVPAAAAQDHDRFDGHRGIRHVLLISIDGMHALDFINCSHGISGVNGGAPYCPHLAALGHVGITYLGASTSKPSDSFPGLMALVTGGSPRTVGAFYDVAYDRSLDPPATTTGNGVAGGVCVPGAPPTGTRTEYDEGIDIDQTKLNGGAPNGVSGGILSIDPNKLVRDPSKGCAPVYPWNFVRTNTIFGVVHNAGGYTAWSDKHPSYSAVSGPGDGSNVDDYYSPDINSAVVNLPGITTPLGISCATIPDASQVGSWTDSFQNIQCYDTLKVDAILNEIDGKTHDGKTEAPVPNVFGMNFQVVSVGQKLIEPNVAKGGYQDAMGTPTDELLSEIQFADASIGEMVSHLKHHGLFDSTLIIITAKHGQNPIDSTRFNEPATTPATILDSFLPDSEKPSNPTGIGPTEDDISLIWLADSSQVENAVNLLETTSPPSNNVAGIRQIFWGPAITQMFNSPSVDPRTPDIIVTPNGGVVFTGSSKKLAEHGGFAHDDTNVMMLLSNPRFEAKTITSPVETMQVAPTILKALGLNPGALQAVQKEGTQVLPGLEF